MGKNNYGVVHKLAITIALLAATGIAQGHVILDSPNGGEELLPGSEFTITWHILISHLVSDWDLWYSTTGDNGPWEVIILDLPVGDMSAGSVYTYKWTAPAVFSDHVRVKVVMDGTPYDDISDADFTIVPEPNVCGDPGTEYFDTDINLDCYVNFADFTILASHWLRIGCNSPWWCDSADIDQNEAVNLLDLSLLTSEWLACTDPGESYCDAYWR